MFRYRATIFYIIFIVLLNFLFAYAPVLQIMGEHVPSATILAGFIYVLRDLAQRECHHKIWLAMFAGCIISYWLASPVTAFASAAAFLIGEMIDWAIFTLTGYPLSRRILYSASISSPIDSIVFLALIHAFSIPGLILMIIFKNFGVLFMWSGWHIKYVRQKIK